MEAFAAEVFGSFGRVDQRRWGERYVRGSRGEGQSMEPMAAGVDGRGLRQHPHRLAAGAGHHETIRVLASAGIHHGCLCHRTAYDEQRARNTRITVAA